MRRLALHAAALVATLVALPPLAHADSFAVGTVPASPEDGGFRYLAVAVSAGKLNMRSGASTGAPVTASLGRDTVLSHLGCRAAEGRAWCDVQPVAGGPRGFVAAEFLKPAIAPHGVPLRGVNDSALRAGRDDFDATGWIPCDAAERCDFGVARAGGGDATVVITRLDGKPPRAIFYTLGVPISANTSEADWAPFSAERSGDTYEISVGSERYTVPDAIVFGG